MQTTTIYMFRFSKETSHLDGSFEYPEEIQMIFFSIFSKLPCLMIYPIIRIEQKTYKKQTIYDISFWLPAVAVIVLFAGVDFS